MRRELAAAEDGLTIVEVVVAGMILVLGAIGVLGVVDAATRNTFRAEQSQVVANVLQGEMERLRQIPYSELALTELPTNAGGANHPNSRIEGDHFYAGRNGTGLKPLVYNGGSTGGQTIEGGTVDAGPTPFQVGNVSGTIHRFLVWDTCPASLCQDGKHLKRAIVSVKLAATASGGQNRRYQEVQGQFVDPDAEPSIFPGQKPGGTDTRSWTLWLTDTPCDQGSRQEHPEEDGDHPTHNTRGECADGEQTGNIPGAPDLLWPEAALELPPDVVDYEYDYSEDLWAGEGADVGLQMLPGADCASMTSIALGAETEPEESETTFQRVHRWLSPEIPEPDGDGSGTVLLSGDGSLSLWTQAIGAPQPGGICAWLFVRSGSGAELEDVPVTNLSPPLRLHFDLFEQTWPSGDWAELSLPLSFGHADEGGAVALPPGSRLGLALSVEGGTQNGLQFFYDQPSFDSRLHVETTGALPPGVEPEEPEEP